MQDVVFLRFLISQIKLNAFIAQNRIEIKQKSPDIRLVISHIQFTLKFIRTGIFTASVNYLFGFQGNNVILETYCYLFVK
jgi:hypothetical protein